MVPPIQLALQINVPVKCSNSECHSAVFNQQTAIFVVRHLLVVAYCGPQCYLDTWRRQLQVDDPIRVQEEFLDDLGYYR